MVAYISIYRGRIVGVVGLITLALLAFVGVLVFAFGVRLLSAIPLVLIGLAIALWVITISLLRESESGLPALVSRSCLLGTHGGCSKTTELGSACTCSCHQGRAA